jgi:hypothetical protein
MGSVTLRAPAVGLTCMERDHLIDMSANTTLEMDVYDLFIVNLRKK